MFRSLVFLAILATLTVFVAYQSPQPITILVGNESDRDVKGFHNSEKEPGHSYRWTHGSGAVTFAGIGDIPRIQLTIVAYAWRYENQVFTSTVTVNGNPVGVIDRANWRTWRFDVFHPGTLSGDGLVVGFDSVPFSPSEVMSSEDERQLGIAIDSIQIQRKPDDATTNGKWTDSLVVPSLLQWLFVLAFVSGLFLFSRYLGLDERHAFYAGVASVVAFGIGIAFYRNETSQRVLIFTLAIGAATVLAIVRERNRLMSMVGRDQWRRVGWWSIPAAIGLAALLLRLHGLAALPIEGDDGLYMRVAEEYAQAIQAGDWNHVVALDGVIEHPRLYVLCFSAAIVMRDYLALHLSNVAAMRMVAVLFGAMQAGLIAILNPLAGWFLAIQTTEVKFTSIAYLEALPALTAALSVLSFERFRRTTSSMWLYLSAVALGATGASKFIYVIAGFAIAPFLFWEQRHQLKKIISYGLLATAAFFALDPYLWYDPAGRLIEMFSFHSTFSTREYVQQLARPWYYNVVWLAGPAKIYAPSYDFPHTFLISWDTFIYVLGVLGLPLLLKHSRLYASWLLVGVIFVSLWEAKWEQYSLVIATPLCISAGLCATKLIEWANDRWHHLVSNRSGVRTNVTTNST